MTANYSTDIMDGDPEQIGIVLNPDIFYRIEIPPIWYQTRGGNAS